MNPQLNWQELLGNPVAGDHFVQLYQDDSFLKDAVSQYIGTALQQNEAVISIASPAHQKAFKSVLEGQGFNVEQAMASGQFIMLDAETTLAKFMRNGMPDWDLYLKTVGSVVQEACASFKMVCAYGEMVDILWQQGATEAAISLEAYWNKLGELYSFSLLCAYFIDHLNNEVCGEPFKRVCNHHSHVIPTRDYGRLEKAVTEASEEILSAPVASILPKLAKSYSLSTRMPVAQATLMYLQETLPHTASKILSRIRTTYAAPVASEEP